MSINQEIKNEIKEAGLKCWQIAKVLNINDGNFSRRLRVELSPERKAEIRAIIKELRAVKQNG